MANQYLTGNIIEETDSQILLLRK